MRVESIEDVTTLEPGQAELLQEGINDGWFDETTQKTLVVYRVKGSGGETKPLVAPRNPNVERGSLIVCGGWARVVSRLTLGKSKQADVKLDVAAHVTPDR